MDALRIICAVHWVISFLSFPCCSWQYEFPWKVWFFCHRWWDTGYFLGSLNTSTELWRHPQCIAVWVLHDSWSTSLLPIWHGSTSLCCLTFSSVKLFIWHAANTGATVKVVGEWGVVSVRFIGYILEGNSSAKVWTLSCLSFVWQILVFMASFKCLVGC